jgi:hypothetical protein
MRAFVGGLWAPDGVLYRLESEPYGASARQNLAGGQGPWLRRGRDADTKCGLPATGTEGVGNVGTHHHARKSGVP